MDDELIKDAGVGYLGTAEERIPLGVMYDVAKQPLEHCDRNYGWPVGTAVALRHRYPEKWATEKNKLIDHALGEFQQARVTLLERITSACPKAIEIVTAAMTGEEWNDKPVSKEQRITAEGLLKTFRDFMNDDFTPATQAGADLDDETKAMLEHQSELGLEDSTN